MNAKILKTDVNPNVLSKLGPREFENTVGFLRNLMGKGKYVLRS